MSVYMQQRNGRSNSTQPHQASTKTKLQEVFLQEDTSTMQPLPDKNLQSKLQKQMAKRLSD